MECPPPNPRYYKPVISVTDVNGDLRANPRVALVWDVEPSNPREPIKIKRVNAAQTEKIEVSEPDAAVRSNTPVTITWSGPAGLLVKFREDPNVPAGQNACTTPPQCDGKGQCTAKVKPLAADPNGKKISRRCTYEMSTQKAIDEDADIVVTPCCW